MNPFEVIYLGRSRFHRDQDATAMYFRVMRGGCYVGAYAGAVNGLDMEALHIRPSKPFWAALAHASTRSIGVRLMGAHRTEGALHTAETIWIKPTDLAPHLDEDLPLPVEDEVFRTFAFDEDPLAPPPGAPEPRIVSVGSTQLGLKPAASTPIEGA